MRHLLEEPPGWRRAVAPVLALGLIAFGAQTVAARALEDILARGVISLCAPPNALPFASKKGERRGFQIELAQSIAERLEVRLDVQWVVVSYQRRRVDCDIVMDTIADREAELESGLRWSRPYQRSGVALALGPGLDGIRGFDDLNETHRVGVQRGSLAHMYLERRGVQTIPFAFEDEMIAAAASGEVDAAAATPISIGYYDYTRPDAPLRLIYAYEAVPELSWDLAVGMRRSDRFLRKAVDRAVEAMLEDGTFARVYASYGIEHRPPEAPQSVRRIERAKPLEEGECVRLGRSRECTPSR